jgi:anthranilate phosphoribosyltransferase
VGLSWSSILGELTAGRDLSTAQAHEAMAEILDGAATPAQIAGFIIALRMKGETAAEMTGLVRAMLDVAERVPIDPAGLVDTCGTGGSLSRRSAAFNVSTIAAFVIAGAGVRVCKHGNRGLSSTSGSFDLLEALGVRIDLGPVEVAACIEEAGIGFCFAPRFHPAMRHAGPPRRELGVPTVFNFLGPLANPARVTRQVVGVSDPHMAEIMAGVLRANGAERAMVVCGRDGLDELTTTSTSAVLDIDGDEVRAFEVRPRELGLSPAALSDLAGGDAAANAALARKVLAGEPGPHRDIVVLNAAAGLVVGDKAADLAAGIELAAAAIDDGRAAATLDRLVEAAQG